ncbi:hypothetical protein PJI23_31995, partial [Mycobacterium kansasii]
EDEAAAAGAAEKAKDTETAYVGKHRADDSEAADPVTVAPTTAEPTDAAPATESAPETVTEAAPATEDVPEDAPEEEAPAETPAAAETA